VWTNLKKWTIFEFEQFPNWTILESEHISKMNNYRIRNFECEENFKTKQIFELIFFRIITNIGFKQIFNVNKFRMWTDFEMRKFEVWSNFKDEQILNVNKFRKWTNF
jgi:hypothetical protein